MSSSTFSISPTFSIVKRYAEFVKTNNLPFDDEFTMKQFDEHYRTLIHQELINQRNINVQDNVIYVDLIDAQNQIVSFKVRTDTPLINIVIAYCQREGINNIEVKHNEVLLDPHKTMSELGIQHNDLLIVC